MPPHLSMGFLGGFWFFFWGGGGRWPCFSGDRGERLVVSILFFKKWQKFLRDLHGSQIWTTKN